MRLQGAIAVSLSDIFRRHAVAELTLLGFASVVDQGAPHDDGQDQEQLYHEEKK